MQRSFHTRLILGQATSLLVIVSLCVAALVALRSIQRHTEQSNEIHQRIALVDELRSNARALARSGRRYLLTHDGKEHQRVLAIEHEMDQHRDQLRTRGWRGDARALERVVDEYVSVVIRATSAGSDDPVTVLMRFEDDLHRARNEVAIALDEIVSRERAQLAASRTSQRLVGGARLALLVAAALGVLLTIGVTLAVRRELNRQAERARSAAAGAERGGTSRKELLTASSELRALPEAIMSHSARLQAMRSHDDGELHMLDAISRSAARLDRLLGELLDVAGIEAGTISLRRESCEAAALADRAIKRHRNAAHERGIRMRFEARLALSVHADRERIEQVLTSLVANAIVTAPMGAEIVVSAVPAADGVRFTVTASGPAALPEHINRFEPAAVVPSNDLSLHLCKRAIEAHGGRMGVEAAAAGRAYWFELPTEPSVLR